MSIRTSCPFAKASLSIPAGIPWGPGFRSWACEPWQNNLETVIDGQRRS